MSLTESALGEDGRRKNTDFTDKVEFDPQLLDDDKEADEERVYMQYGNQPLKEIIGYYGLPLFREGQMYGAYEPGD